MEFTEKVCKLLAMLLADQKNMELVEIKKMEG